MRMNSYKIKLKISSLDLPKKSFKNIYHIATTLHSLITLVFQKFRITYKFLK